MTSLPPPRRFHYDVIDARWPDQLWVRDFPGGTLLGSIARDDERDPGDPEPVGWMASLRRDDAYTPGFGTKRQAAEWLWAKHSQACNLGHKPADSAAMADEAPPEESIFAALVRRSGLTTSMATRIAGAANMKTGRRWKKGVDHEGRRHNPRPEAVRLLEAIAVENEAAAKVERKTGRACPRPLRDAAIEDASAREAERRAAREAEGKPTDYRANGIQRARKQVERAERRIAHAEAAAAVLGDPGKAERRRALEAQRAAKAAR